MSKFQRMVEALKKPVEAMGEKVKPFHALEKDPKLRPVLHAEVLAALKQLQRKHPETKKVIAESAGYAVVPSIGRASLALGGAYGIGEVFVHDEVIGYGAIVGVTLGVQVGGTTFHELVVFHDEGSLKRFKSGKFALAADAAVELVKAGGQKSKGFGATSSVYVFADGGMLLDFDIGVQKFIFKPAAELAKAKPPEGGVEVEKEAAPGGGERERASEERPAAERPAAERPAAAEEEQPGAHPH